MCITNETDDMNVERLIDDRLFVHVGIEKLKNKISCLLLLVHTLHSFVFKLPCK